MARTRSPWMKPFRIAKAHRRLFMAAVVGVAAFFVFADSWRLSLRLLLGWDAGVLLYLLASVFTMARFDLKRVRARAKDQDEGATLMLVLTVAASMASVGAIVALLTQED